MEVTSENYVGLVIKTESVNFGKIREKLSDIKVIRLLHAGMGLCTEAGEFVDQLKRHIFYGADLDLINLAEEIGDTYWYCGLGLDAVGVNMNSVLRANIKKLARRYPDKFKELAAVVRDVNAERKELES